MRSDRNFNPEWGYVAPAPSVMRTARLIVVAAIIGATAGAAAVFSLLDRRVGEKSVAARTLVVPDPMRPVATSRSVADQQRPEPPQAKSPPRAENSAEQKVRPDPGRGGGPSAVERPCHDLNTAVFDKCSRARRGSRSKGDAQRYNSRRGCA